MVKVDLRSTYLGWASLTPSCAEREQCLCPWFLFHSCREKSFMCLITSTLCLLLLLNIYSWALKFFKIILGDCALFNVICIPISDVLVVEWLEVQPCSDWIQYSMPIQCCHGTKIFNNHEIIAPVYTATKVIRLTNILSHQV